MGLTSPKSAEASGGFFFCGPLCIGIGWCLLWGVDASFFSQSLDWWPQERSSKPMVIQWLFNDILDISGQWIGYLMAIQWLSNGGYEFGVQLGSVSDLTCGVYFWWATAWPQFHDHFGFACGSLCTHGPSAFLEMLCPPNGFVWKWLVPLNPMVNDHYPY